MKKTKKTLNSKYSSDDFITIEIQHKKSYACIFWTLCPWPFQIDFWNKTNGTISDNKSDLCEKWGYAGPKLQNGGIERIYQLIKINSNTTKTWIMICKLEIWFA